MKISILTVGKIKEKYLRDAIAEYSKRLGRYCKLEIIEVSDEKTPDNASETVEDAIRNKEGERLLKYIRDDAFVITLEIGGEQLTSENFARKINELGIRGTSHIQFVIGGSISIEEIRLCFKLFEDDISSSADACDPSGTDLPQLSYHQRRALS